MPSPEELHIRGVVASGAGRLRRARTLLERAVALATDDSRPRIEVSLAFALSELGESARAMELCDAVRNDLAVDPTVRGVAEAQRAVLLVLGARPAEAVEGFTRALGLVGSDHPADLGKAHLNRGVLYLQLNDPAAAEEDLAVATQQLRVAELSVEAAGAEHNLGYARLLRGDLVGALTAMDAAHDVLASLSPPMRAAVEQDRAEVLFAAGQHSEAFRALEGAAQAYGQRRLRRRQAEAELALARRLLTADPRAAETWARTAARRFRRAGHVAWANRADALAVTASVAQGRAQPKLRADAEQVSGALEEQGLAWEARTAELAAARIDLARGETDLARSRILARGLRRRAPLDLRLTERDVRAELAAASGRRSDALAHLTRGLAELTEWQSSFGSLDLQTNVVGQGAQLAARGLELAVGSRSPAVWFEWSERARMLASQVQPVRLPADPTLAEDLAELRAAPAPEREAELRRRIRERAWRKQGSGEVSEPVGLDELRAGMDGHALVSHLVAGERVVALVVTEDGVSRVDLGTRAQLAALLGGLLPDLDVAAGRLTGQLAQAVRGDLVARLGRLAEMLVAPVRAAVGDRPVVLTPSGMLAGVPWTLLPGLTGRPLTLAQSATSWLRRRARPWLMGSAGLVAGPRVARAEDEVIAAAKEWADARRLTGSGATAAAASELAGGVDVLHVAAHGRHSAESPLFSGVQLSDGPWFGYDIDQLERVPDVVLLSACEVGRSTVRWGEELIGMTAAWLHAGARCVIASPAAVADTAAYDALVGVHHALSAGTPPADALAAAVPAPSTDAPPAPFVCFG